MKEEFYGVSYKLYTTYFTRPITLKEYYFKTREDRDAFLQSRKKKWWEYLPTVTRFGWIGKDTKENIENFTK